MFAPSLEKHHKNKLKTKFLSYWVFNSVCNSTKLLQKPTFFLLFFNIKKKFLFLCRYFLINLNPGVPTGLNVAPVVVVFSFFIFVFWIFWLLYIDATQNEKKKQVNFKRPENCYRALQSFDFIYSFIENFLPPFKEA